MTGETRGENVLSPMFHSFPTHRYRKSSRGDDSKATPYDLQEGRVLDDHRSQVLRLGQVSESR